MNILLGSIGVALIIGLCLCSCLIGACKRQTVIELVRCCQFLWYYLRLTKGRAASSLAESWCDVDEGPFVWAHAGGGDPILYGNAQENFDRAIQKGYRHLEVDVGLTSDGVPVLTHMFRPNWENLYEGTPSKGEFLATPLDDRYTPMTLDMFVERYHDFNGWFFLDGLRFGKSDRYDYVKHFEKVDESFRKKVIVQVFAFGDLLALKQNNPFGGIHFSGAYGIGTKRLLRPLLIKVLKSCGVRSISVSDWELKKDVAGLIRDFRDAGIVVSVAGVNTISYFKRLRKLGVNCIDSDYLTPMIVRDAK